MEGITGKLLNHKKHEHPRTGQIFYTGNIYDDTRHRFFDGDLISTSEVTEHITEDGKSFIRTLNSMYELISEVPKKYTDIMVDTETLSTATDAFMLSIGVLAFDIDTGRIQNIENGAYARFTAKAQRNRRIDHSTVAWWMRQSPEAQDEVFSDISAFSGRVIDDDFDLYEFLRGYINRYTVGSDEVRVWAKSPQFDLVKIGTFISDDFDPLWSFRNEQCVRTEIRGHDVSGIVRNGVYHHALHDCLHQIKEVLSVNGKL